MAAEHLERVADVLAPERASTADRGQTVSDSGPVPSQRDGPCQATSAPQRQPPQRRRDLGERVKGPPRLTRVPAPEDGNPARERPGWRLAGALPP